MCRQPLFALLVWSLTWSLTCFLPCILFAQPLEQRLKQLPTPAKQLESEAMIRVLCRSVWEGKGSYLPLWIATSNGKGEELGLTPRQIEELGAVRMHREFDRKKETGDAEVAAAVQALQQARPKDDPELEKADAAQKRQFLEAAIRSPMLMHGSMQKRIEKTLSEDQLRKLRALELQMLAGAGFPNPGMFEALRLTPEQRKKMSEIREKSTPEFDRFLDGLLDISKEQDKLVRDLLTDKFRGREDISQEEWNKALQEARKEAAESERIRKLRSDNSDQGLGLAARYQFELMDVLTDDQIDEMQRLLDTKPEFVKNLIAAIEKHREEMKKSGDWQPGLDSWHPDDGVTEEFKRQRKSGKMFPQTEQ